MTVPHPVECEIMPESDVMDLFARHVEFIRDVFASKALIMADKLAFQNFGGVSKTIIAALEKNKGKGGKLVWKDIQECPVEACAEADVILHAIDVFFDKRTNLTDIDFETPTLDALGGVSALKLLKAMSAIAEIRADTRKAATVGVAGLDALCERISCSAEMCTVLTTEAMRMPDDIPQKNAWNLIIANEKNHVAELTKDVQDFGWSSHRKTLEPIVELYNENKTEFDNLQKRAGEELPEDSKAAEEKINAILVECKTPAMKGLKKIFISWQKTMVKIAEALERLTEDGSVVNIDVEGEESIAERFRRDVGVDALDLRVLTATAMLFQAAYAPSRADTDEKKAAEKKKTCKGAIEYVKARFARLCRT